MNEIFEVSEHGGVSEGGVRHSTVSPDTLSVVDEDFGDTPDQSLLGKRGFTCLGRHSYAQGQAERVPQSTTSRFCILTGFRSLGYPERYHQTLSVR